MDLSETVPYIGASAVQADGYDGSGVRVAVLDSGIDYNHAAFGGSGNPADYAANDPNIIEAGTFPTAKVVGGYDFVGSDWPNTDEAPDPDPLDDGPEAGHGSHVGHIIGWCRRCCPWRGSLCGQGLFIGLHLLLRYCPDPGHGICRRSGWRR